MGLEITLEDTNQLKSSLASPWILNCSNDRREPRIRLLCFPFAGGNANFFLPWADNLPRDVELLAIQLPGRSARFNEKPVSSLSVLLDQLTPAVLPLLQQPCVFFGHSMGGVVAYELAAKLISKRRSPSMLILSACSAPNTKPNPQMLHNLPTDDFWNKVKSINGTPEELLNNKELLNLLEPALRADFKLVYDWQLRYQHTSPPVLPIPFQIFGGTEDQSVRCEALEGWKNYSSRKSATHYFNGDHFFINREKKQLLKNLSEILASIGY